MTVKEFLEKYSGEKVDFDKFYGAQCFTKDHCVLMSDWTYKPIQDVVVGDKVIGYDYSANTVTKVFKSHKEVVCFRTDLADLCVTKDHPFYCMDGTFQPAEKLPDSRPAVFSYERFEPSGLTDNELRFLGFWLGDGNKVEYHDGRSADVRVVYGEKKAPWVRGLGVLSSECRHGGTAYTGGVKKTEHKQLVDFLVKRCAGENKQLPLVFTNREYSLILEGLVHADGCQKNNSYVVTNTSKPLLLAVQAAALLLGYRTKGLRPHRRSSAPISIKGQLVKSVKPMWRLTLAERNFKGKGGRLLSSVFAEDTGSFAADVYNLETDGSHTYICDNYRVHNCVDLFRQYCADVLGAKRQPGAVVGAKDFYEKYESDPATQKLFDKLPQYTEPVEGDVAFWGASSGNKYGHVAVVLGYDAQSRMVTVLEQDGFKQDGAKVAKRFVDGVLGYLRPKGREAEA